MDPRTRLSLLPAALLVAACSSGAPSIQPTLAPATQAAAATAAAASHDFVKDVAVDGRTMHVICVGPIDSGRPTVLFESGLGGDAGQWGAVLSELQTTDRACAYDRAGVGQSEPAPGTVTTADQVEALRGLLEAIDVEPPYVLVGFSVGGWNVLVHDDAHGDDVASAVLVDVRPPRVSGRWLEALPPQKAGEPEGVRLNREDLTVFEADPTLNPETLDLQASAAEAIATSGFGDKPVVVLAAGDTAGIEEGLPNDLAATFAGIWWEEQQWLADLSTIGRLEKVENTSHDMPYERTDAVIAAIREVLGH